LRSGEKQLGAYATDARGKRVGAVVKAKARAKGDQKQLIALWRNCALFGSITKGVMKSVLGSLMPVASL